MSAVLRFLLMPRGGRRWDVFLRATGVITLVGIPIALAFPKTVPLVWFAILALIVNGPIPRRPPAVAPAVPLTSGR